MSAPVQFNLMYLVGVVLVCAGNLLFYWRPVLGLEDLSSLVGSSGSSGDTELSSDTASCAGSGIRWGVQQIISYWIRYFAPNISRECLHCLLCREPREMAGQGGQPQPGLVPQEH